jgi:hypothetical protein
MVGYTVSVKGALTKPSIIQEQDIDFALTQVPRQVLFNSSIKGWQQSGAISLCI